jgi:HAMP domain-containing protein
MAALVVLLVLSEVVSIVAERQILRARAEERVDGDLTREVEELRRLVSEGVDPNTGAPFGGDVQRIFDVVLQRNVPSEREAVFTYLGTRPYRSSVGNPDDRTLETELRALGGVQAPRRGEVQTSRTLVRYVAVPVSVGGERRGAMVVTADLGAERAEVDDALRTTGAVTLAVLVFAIALAWVIAGRVLAPLRHLTETARSITETDLTRRLDVHGDDEIAELTRTFIDPTDYEKLRLLTDSTGQLFGGGPLPRAVRQQQRTGQQRMDERRRRRHPLEQAGVRQPTDRTRNRTHRQPRSSTGVEQGRHARGGLVISRELPPRQPDRYPGGAQARAHGVQKPGLLRGPGPRINTALSALVRAHWRRGPHGGGPVASPSPEVNAAMRRDELELAAGAWLAARNGQGIVITDDSYPAADRLAQRGWLRREFTADNELAWFWNPQGDQALELGALLNEQTGEDRRN